MNDYSKIEVHERDQKRARYAVQHIGIYFNHIGKIENELTQLADPTEQEIKKCGRKSKKRKRKKAAPTTGNIGQGKRRKRRYRAVKPNSQQLKGIFQIREIPFSMPVQQALPTERSAARGNLPLQYQSHIPRQGQVRCCRRRLPGGGKNHK